MDEWIDWGFDCCCQDAKWVVTDELLEDWELSLGVDGAEIHCSCDFQGERARREICSIIIRVRTKEKRGHYKYGGPIYLS